MILFVLYLILFLNICLIGLVVLLMFFMSLWCL